jgi:predicted metal-dependent enzyme (double-stranded beta helix superfamily)
MTVSAATASPPAFSPCPVLRDRLESSIAEGGTTTEITSRVEHCLRRAIAEGAIVLPDVFRRPCKDCYARRLLFQSPELGYTVVVMVWGPGQGTLLHDHSGMWCVEAVVEGKLGVTQYELMEQAGERYRFETRDSVEAGVGSAGKLIPPFEYHTIRNVLDDGASISLHVYGGEMVECGVFQPCEDGWYEYGRRQLSYTL